MYFIENHLTYSKNDIYKKILTGISSYNEDSRKSMLETNDMIIMHKMFFYKKS